MDHLIGITLEITSIHNVLKWHIVLNNMIQSGDVGSKPHVEVDDRNASCYTVQYRWESDLIIM